MSTWYVDSRSGRDRNSGTSLSSAWRTLRRATRQPLASGQRLKLKRGSIWAETLTLKGRAAPGRPIVLEPYGTGRRPKIIVKQRHGVVVGGPISGWQLNGLEIAGEQPFDPKGRKHGGTCGIYLHQREAGEGFVINDCLIHDVDGHGILLKAGDAPGTTFTGVTITNCEIHHASTGIAFGGPWPPGDDPTRCIADFRIAHCRTHDIGADGIVLSRCQDGVIEHSTAWRTGLGRIRRSPVGIWFFQARRCVIQFCESYENRNAGNRADGGGFDLDGGCIDCVMQYNYSHDNDGAGYLICSYDPKGAPLYGCVTRFNISVNDGLANDYSSILFWQAGPCKTYNNTCITRVASPLKFTSSAKGHLIANNVFVVDSKADFPLVKSAFPVEHNRFRNNLYYRTGGPARFSLRQDKGLDFRGFCNAVNSADEILADPRLSDLSGEILHPRPGSPLLGAGLVVPDWGSRDYYGFAASDPEALNIGCSFQPPD